jgi:hypothetical protein
MRQPSIRTLQFMRMRITVWELLFVTLLLGPLLADGAWEHYEAYRGERDGSDAADADIRAGLKQIVIGGKRSSVDAAVRGTFKERYGIELRRLYECCPTTYQSYYRAGYNQRMESYFVNTISESFDLNRAYREIHNEANGSARLETENRQPIRE